MVRRRALAYDGREQLRGTACQLVRCSPAYTGSGPPAAYRLSGRREGNTLASMPSYSGASAEVRGAKPWVDLAALIGVVADAYVRAMRSARR